MFPLGSSPPLVCFAAHRLGFNALASTYIQELKSRTNPTVAGAKFSSVKSQLSTGVLRYPERGCEFIPFAFLFLSLQDRLVNMDEITVSLKQVDELRGRDDVGAGAGL